MSTPLDFKGILAIVVVVFDFVLIGASIVLRNGAPPDAVVIGFVSSSLSLVLGFYFGYHNGTVAQAAASAVSSASRADTMLALAQQRRHGDPPPSAGPSNST